MSKTIIFNNNKYQEGDSVIFSIRDSQFAKGKIHIENEKEFYICHSSYAYEGNESPNMLGYPYSWVIDLDENNCSLEQSDRVQIYHECKDLRKINFNLTPKVRHFANKFLKDTPIFSLELPQLKGFYSISECLEKDSVVLLNQNRKNVTIKLGRLLRRLFVQYNELINDTKNSQLEINDEFIEKIHNEWSSFNIEVDYKILKGEEILNGYDSKKYSKYAKITSCMTDRFNFLKLYTSNPDKISLITFHYNDEMCGRCLLWKADDGITYHDRIYNVYQWMTPSIQKVLKDNGYINAYGLNKKINITLENTEHKAYPYVDTFCYGKGNLLTNMQDKDSTRHYRSASGSFTPLK